MLSRADLPMATVLLSSVADHHHLIITKKIIVQFKKILFPSDDLYLTIFSPIHFTLSGVCLTSLLNEFHLSYLFLPWILHPYPYLLLILEWRNFLYITSIIKLTTLKITSRHMKKNKKKLWGSLQTRSCWEIITRLYMSNFKLRKRLSITSIY